MCLREMQQSEPQHDGEWKRGTAARVLRLLNQADAFPKYSAVILPQLGLACRKQMDVIKLGAGWMLRSHWAVCEQAHSIPAPTHIKPAEN